MKSTAIVNLIKQDIYMAGFIKFYQSIMLTLPLKNTILGRVFNSKS